MADPQQTRVYKWEGEWVDWNRASASALAIRKAIRTAERAYAVPKMKIWLVKNNRSVCRMDGRSGKGLRLPTFYDPSTHAIHIRPRHRNIATALHEAAHGICDAFFGNVDHPEFPAHGPLWLGIYLNLLIAAEVAPKNALIASAKQRGLKYAPLGKISPAKIRQSYAGLIDRAQFV